MDILIISEFCGDFSDSDNDRFLYLAKTLSGRHDVEIVTSAFYHTSKAFRTRTATEWPFRSKNVGFKANFCNVSDMAKG